MYHVELKRGSSPAYLNSTINRTLEKLNYEIKLLIDIKYSTQTNNKGETDYFAHIIYEKK